jgi:hypothetical protein
MENLIDNELNRLPQQARRHFLLTAAGLAGLTVSTQAIADFTALKALVAGSSIVRKVLEFLRDIITAALDEKPATQQLAGATVQTEKKLDGSGEERYFSRNGSSLATADYRLDGDRTWKFIDANDGQGSFGHMVRPNASSYADGRLREPEVDTYFGLQKAFKASNIVPAAPWSGVAGLSDHIADNKLIDAKYDPKHWSIVGSRAWNWDISRPERKKAIAFLAIRAIDGKRAVIV